MFFLVLEFETIYRIDTFFIFAVSSLLSFYRKPVEYFLKAVDEVSAKDIASIAQKLLSTPLTMASYGDGNSFSIYVFVEE